MISHKYTAGGPWSGHGYKTSGHFAKPRHRSVFDSAPVDYSPATQKVISELMDEARLTVAQRNKALFPLLRDDVAPGSVGRLRTVVGSGKGKKRSSSTGSSLTNVSGCCSPAGSTAPVVSRSVRRGGKRPRSVILATGVWDREQYVSDPSKGGRDLIKEVEKLQNMMTYGQEADAFFALDGVETAGAAMMSEKVPGGLDDSDSKSLKVVLPGKCSKNSTTRYAELLEEIGERETFLEKMKKLGLGDKYKSIIDSQISSKNYEIKMLQAEAQRKLEIARLTAGVVSR